MVAAVGPQMWVSISVSVVVFVIFGILLVRIRQLYVAKNQASRRSEARTQRNEPTATSIHSFEALPGMYLTSEEGEKRMRPEQEAYIETMLATLMNQQPSIVPESCAICLLTPASSEHGLDRTEERSAQGSLDSTPRTARSHHAEVSTAVPFPEQDLFLTPANLTITIADGDDKPAMAHLPPSPPSPAEGAEEGGGRQEEISPAEVAVDMNEERIVALPCGHAFHLGCLMGWMRHRSARWSDPTCAICRRSIAELLWPPAIVVE